MQRPLPKTPACSHRKPFQTQENPVCEVSAWWSSRRFSSILSTSCHRLNRHPEWSSDRWIPLRPGTSAFGDAQMAGFHSGADAPEGVLPITDRMARSTRCRFWIIEVDGVPAGSGGVEFHETSSVLISGCTSVEFRSRGLQSAFIRYRLHRVAEHGASYALLESLPGDTTERNVLRAGFSPCFTQKLLQQS